MYRGHGSSGAMCGYNQFKVNGSVLFPLFSTLKRKLLHRNFQHKKAKKKKGRKKKKKKGGGSTGIEPSNLRPLTTLPAPYGSDLRPLALPLGPLPSPYRNDLRPLETLPHGRPKSCRGAATGRHRSGDGAARRQGEGKRKERKKKREKKKSHENSLKFP